MSTIVALSTPVGRGALAVVRLSGTQALPIAKNLCPDFDNVKVRRATLAKVRLPGSRDILDEVLITFFKSPQSVTGEDVIEISCHGSPVVVRQILDLAISFGARLAEPGEFTLRALSNGKINLVEAEAIRDLIAAQTQAAVRQATRQMGELSQSLTSLEERLIKVIVLLESAVEFVEDDLPATELGDIKAELCGVRQEIAALSDSYAAGRLLQSGIKVAIVGSPNVGKSSLFNRLVCRDRAIVTELPGTTRDTLLETIDLDGIPVLLTDTAGLRETSDAIETLGIERTQRAISDADIVVEVLDATVPSVEDSHFLNSIRVLNKCDLEIHRSYADESQSLRVSALTGEGLDELRTAILGFLDRSEHQTEGVLITNARHYDLLKCAGHELDLAIGSLNDGLSEELILVPLHNALRLLGQITGETTTEDILTQVFSTFCIGK
ncbi:MAG TPA: tRNA uridine-5-carboxymethylaminomethyl(34) synthesis GTPase MnmE [Pyrinomonadaceae bacterium]|nr:tRNA uridine-5-carboxymethylaminomethyl(34) synthesis GTPase MnmE [Pyrinomonadaceae bacterium]